MNKNELYHYYGGSLNVTDELLHYGVPGMRWGQRRAQRKINRLKEKISNLETKRTTIAKERGYTSNKYGNLSRKQYVLKQKQAVQKAKLKGDKDAKRFAKKELRKAKAIRDEGAFNMSNAELKKIYGKNVSSQNLKAIAKKERTRRSVNLGLDLADIGLGITNKVLDHKLKKKQ